MVRRTLWLIFYLLLAVVTTAQTYPISGGAEITAPFQRSVSGAVCFTGRGKLEGSAFFNFPTQEKKVLSFTIGPAGSGQEKNDKFNGAGTYSNIIIFIKPQDGDAITSTGEVVVNDDERTGTFTFKSKGGNDDDENQDNAAGAGTWDCGRKLPH